jgi:hypothetical protein
MSWKAAWPVVLAACGCTVQTLETNEQSRAERLFALTANWPAFAQSAGGQPPRGTIDILFMVDNSSSMAALQGQLLAGFDTFMNVLDTVPGGTPDMHIGVISSDLGAGDGSIEKCDGEGGDRGRLQFVSSAECPSMAFDGGARFIKLGETGGRRVTNYGDVPLAQAFACLARLGENGCGFEQPFAAVKHALDPVLAPPENLGFLRREASLAVIMISNEDDCSANPAVPLFDTAQNLSIGSQLGPPTNFRCNEFGHICSGYPPPRTATGPLRDCRSNETGVYLETIAGFIEFLRQLKGDPAKVFVASVAGPPTPYQVRVKPPILADTADWPEIGHSCTTADGAFADPAVRLNELAETLGPYGHFESICGDSMFTPLRRIASMLTKPLARACVARPSMQASCQVVDRWIDADGIKQVTQLPRCIDAPGVTPCWSLTDDSGCRSTEQLFAVDRDDAAVPPGLMTAINCNNPLLPPPL